MQLHQGCVSMVVGRYFVLLGSRRLSGGAHKRPWLPDVVRSDLVPVGLGTSLEFLSWERCLAVRALRSDLIWWEGVGAGFVLPSFFGDFLAGWWALLALSPLQPCLRFAGSKHLATCPAGGRTTRAHMVRRDGDSYVRVTVFEKCMGLESLCFFVLPRVECTYVGDKIQKVLPASTSPSAVCWLVLLGTVLCFFLVEESSANSLRPCCVLVGMPPAVAGAVGKRRVAVRQSEGSISCACSLSAAAAYLVAVS